MPVTYRPTEVIRVLEYLGWERRSGRGDHVNLTKPGVRFVVTIDTGKREVPKGTLANILRLAGLSRREFERIGREVL
jgi:predicted RNA binding protein YcfA (HicA-like mRNA interferase family)